VYFIELYGKNIIDKNNRTNVKSEEYQTIV